MFEAHQDEMQADMDDKDVRIEALEVSAVAATDRTVLRLHISGSTGFCQYLGRSQGSSRLQVAFRARSQSQQA